MIIMGDRGNIKLVHGNKANQPGLFDEQGKGSEGLEQVVNSTPAPSTKEVLNTAAFYGFSEDNLSPFLRTPRDYALQRAYYGMNNFESLNGDLGVPDSVLMRMNTADIIALYIGIQQAKYDAHGSQNLNGQIRIARENFPSLISKLVHKGWEYTGVAGICNKGFSLHSRISGALIDRMQYISQEDREKFGRSLAMPLRVPGQTTTELRYEFRNPFGRGEDEYDKTAREILIKNIVSFMEAVYIKNAQKRQ